MLTQRNHNNTVASTKFQKFKMKNAPDSSMTLCGPANYLYLGDDAKLMGKLCGSTS